MIDIQIFVILISGVVTGWGDVRDESALVEDEKELFVLKLGKFYGIDMEDYIVIAGLDLIQRMVIRVDMLEKTFQKRRHPHY